VFASFLYASRKVEEGLLDTVSEVEAVWEAELPERVTWLPPAPAQHKAEEGSEQSSRSLATSLLGVAIRRVPAELQDRYRMEWAADLAHLSRSRPRMRAAFSICVHAGALRKLNATAVQRVNHGD
jgi:hypothetical protein